MASQSARVTPFIAFATLLGVSLLLLIGGQPALSQTTATDGDDAVRRALHFQRVAADIEAGDALVTPEERVPQSLTPCVDGMAGIYPCDNVDLLAFMPISTIGGGTKMNDIWGWQDPLTRKEYALAGRNTGTAFVDISDPQHPIYLGDLPKHSYSSSWRDIKVYANHAFIVSEAPSHGMQIFDLTQLRTATPGTTFTETAFYGEVTRSHNVVINEETGFAYIVGARDGGTTCSGGLHMVNIQDPTAPTFAGCYSADGYTHDAQCVVYRGPDTSYRGSEICFNANEDTVTIVDVTDKSLPAQIARVGYSGSGYTHQAWLDGTQSILYVDDEVDEINNGHNTRTYIWNVADLDNPTLIAIWDGPTASIDHNLYWVNDKLYQSQYTAGLYILDARAPINLSQLGYFDLYPSSNGTTYNGAWSNYPYFESGTIIATSINSGLFILDYKGDNEPPTATTIAYLDAMSNDTGIVLSWATTSEELTDYFNIYRSTSPDNLGQRLNSEPIMAQNSGLPEGASYEYFDGDVRSGIQYFYTLDVQNLDGTVDSVGPLLAVFESPTAILLANIEASSTTQLPITALALGLLIVLASTLIYRRKKYL